jgi:hypothetical protein
MGQIEAGERKPTKEPTQKLASEPHLSMKQGMSNKLGSKGEMLPALPDIPLRNTDYKDQDKSPSKKEETEMEQPDTARKEKISKAFESYSAGQFIKINEGSFKDTYKTGKVLGEG